MKILSISHSCVVSEYQKRMVEVAKYSDVEMTLLVPGHWIQFNKKVNLEKITDAVYRILCVQPITWGLRENRFRNVTHIYPGIKKILKRLEPDIVELWEEPFSAVTAHTTFWTKRIIPGAKIIFFSAQNVLRRYPPPFCTFEKYTYKNSHYAFLMSHDVAGVLRRKGFNKEFCVLPLGVDTEFFCKKDVSCLKEKLGLKSFVIGFVGKINRQKGILDLVQAASQIDRKIHLLIIGNGDLKQEMKHLIKLSGLGQRSIHVEAVGNSQVPDYLNCMDILVFPSITLPNVKEQFGRVLIEAMACQVPVIGSNSGEIPTILKDAGITFKERDVKDLKNKIQLLMRDNNLRRKIVKNGHRKVMDNYTWKSIAEKQSRVYKRLIKEKNL